MIAFFESFGVIVNFVILLIAAGVAYAMHRVSRPFVHFAMVVVLGVTLLSGYETWLGHPVTLAPITQSLNMASFHSDSLACLFQLLIIGGGAHQSSWYLCRRHQEDDAFSNVEAYYDAVVILSFDNGVSER